MSWEGERRDSGCVHIAREGPQLPEAAIRWYERALKLPGIDEETRIALNYELASAFENAGNKPAALSHFMEVYGSNIDYRDVAERIKALKS